VCIHVEMLKICKPFFQNFFVTKYKYVNKSGKLVFIILIVSFTVELMSTISLSDNIHT